MLRRRRRETVWLRAGASRLRVRRIRKIDASIAGRLSVRLDGHREPAVIAMDGTSAVRTRELAEELRVLVKRYRRRGAASVLIGFRPACEGGLPCWSVIALLGWEELHSPPPAPYDPVW